MHSDLLSRHGSPSRSAPTIPVARLSKQERANDTRRKVLLGALVLHRLENANDPEFTKRLADWLRRELPGFLTRDNDKALFDDILM